MSLTTKPHRRRDDDHSIDEETERELKELDKAHGGHLFYDDSPYSLFYYIPRPSAFPLVSFHDAPDYLQDNDHILGHYRAPLHSYWLCFWSSFAVHNETVNIQTHMWAAAAFAWLMYAKFVAGGSVFTSDANVFNMYFAASVTLFILSSTFHSVASHSEAVHDTFAFCDYFAIGLQISASAVSESYFILSCAPVWRDIFMFCTVAATVFVVSLAYHPKFKTPKYRKYRTGVFVILGASPMIQKFMAMYLHGITSPVMLTNYYFTAIGGSAYLIGALLFALRIPERFSPGSFDIVGHGHNWHHVCVIIGALMHAIMLNHLQEFYNTHTCEAILRPEMAHVIEA